ncbi:threonine/homoserine/homoserine lactone efflux protein [Litoreibacter halocynthiae]|uniref:Threonine/homoserine/homoserine lactone efflux protein n=1 Tax=Litoreibacter halocynthiae TaxID=1242689 RepID=A0A4R7LQW7_9RHOB|nr:LysE family translocator [Litoreibacter halocynthiae]TDT77192.1 threonine/homoserine/homoserine lactone efflux protein [Litoreibacter halocynthiae]
MTYELLTALIVFAFVSSATPGPNNLMLMASGANFGFRRSVPHMLGISVGFMLMVFLVGIGLVQVFDLYPLSHTILKVASVAYMSWLAWKIANAAPPKQGEAGGTPMTFLQAAAFQWVNPKAWAMALTAVTVYAPTQSVAAVALVAAIFGAVNAPSVSVWTVMGQQMRRILTNPMRLRVFNWVMAALLMASLYPLLSQTAV